MSSRWRRTFVRRFPPRDGGDELRGERGVAALEFALVLPILVMLLLGIVEYGMIFGDQLALTHAAREGARLAAVGKFDAATVISRAYPVTPTVTTSPNPVSSAKRGDPVKVTLTYAYDWTVLPIPGTITLTGSATMRRE